MASGGSSKSLSGLYSRLAGCIEKNKISKSVNVCDQILKDEKDHQVTQQVLKTKCVCLIWQGKWEMALEIAVDHKFLYEQAYCLYKMKETRKALQVLESKSSELERGEKHLQAQILYRMGAYQQARELYESLLAEDKEPTPELLANYAAACVLSGEAANFLEMIKNHQEKLQAASNYELTYNTACASLAMHDLESARTMIEQAERLGTEYLTADDLLSEENVASEMAVVRLQKGYTFQQDKPLSKERKQEVKDIYLECLSCKPQDVTVPAVAANNLLAVRGEHELFDSYKSIRAAVTNTALDRLPDSYGSKIAMNKALLLLKMQKGRECRESVEVLQSQFPESAKPLLIEVSLLLKEKKNTKCIERLKQLISENKDIPSKGAPLVLALAEIRLMSGQREEALKTLKEAPGTLRFDYDVVSAVALLLQGLETAEAAKEYIHGLVQQAKQDSLSTESQLRLALLEGECLLECKEFTRAADIFKEVMSVNVNTNASLKMEALANFVVATSHFDLDASEANAKSLPVPPVLGSVDVQDLDRGSALKGSSRQFSSTVTKSANIDAKVLREKVKATRQKKIMKKRAKLREAHLAKLKEENGPDFDPAKNKPDAERWVPKNMREKAIRARRKKGGKLTGAQGVGDHVGRDAAKLDIHSQDNTVKAPTVVSSRRKGKGRR